VQVEASAAQPQWMLPDVRPVFMLCSRVRMHVITFFFQKNRRKNNNDSGIPAPALDKPKPK
jgi:hypothetical protein